MSSPGQRVGADLPPVVASGGVASLLLYQLVFLLAFCAYSPVLLWRLAFDRRYRGGLLERIGFAPRSVGRTPVVWIHAVSVGELKAARQMIEALACRVQEFEVVVSSTTPTGRALARQLYPQVRTFYYPFDFGPFAWLALRRVAPAVVILVELECWPSFLYCASQRRIPVAVVNGRISESSFQGYRRIRRLVPPFVRVDRFCVQDETYRRRLLELGVATERVFVTGNMKYDAVRVGTMPGAAPALRRWLSCDGQLVLVCGSTHADEERRVLELALRVARLRQVALRVVLAPRHPERAPAVREAISACGARAVAWSVVQADLPRLAADDVVMVDTIGHLESFYAAGDVAFVGGSLVPRGGQNMLEPAALGKPVVFGPYTANFRNDVELLLSASAAIQVAGDGELAEVLARLLSDPEERSRLGTQAVALITRNQGATGRTLDLLDPLLVRRQAGGVRPETGRGESGEPTSSRMGSPRIGT
jgi:3-deoxy-D-manno-octulosonic-acid transferase